MDRLPVLVKTALLLTVYLNNICAVTTNRTNEYLEEIHALFNKTRHIHSSTMDPPLDKFTTDSLDSPPFDWRIPFRQTQLRKGNMATDLPSFKKFPKMVVFDLDYTLWPFWVDTHVSPPFKKFGNKVRDMTGRDIKFYKEVPALLEYLKKNGVNIAAASRTEEINGAHQLIGLFDWEKYFDHKQIFPAQKTLHFAKLKKSSGIDYEDMVFYDDEERNHRDVQPLGVTCVFVKDGMNKDVLMEGLKQWESRHL